MAPRRGNGGFISGYGSHNPWNDEVQLTLDYYRDEYKSFFYASFAFDILSLIAFIVFFIWACTIRNRSLPVKSLIFALLSFLS